MVLQMHSKDLRMAEKYQRDRLTIPIRMVSELCEDLRQAGKVKPRFLKRAKVGDVATATAAAPVASSSSSSSSPASSSDDSSDAQVTHLSMFYVKKGKAGKILPNWKYHVCAADNPDRLACHLAEYRPTALEAMGRRPPADALICRNCMRSRPDVAAKVGRWKLKVA
jgi:hypothetical protein